jgi:hypothetical protein
VAVTVQGEERKKR